MVDVSNPSIKEQKQSVSSTSEVLKTRPKNYKSGAEVSQAGSNKNWHYTLNDSNHYSNSLWIPVSDLNHYYLRHFVHIFICEVNKNYELNTTNQNFIDILQLLY